MGKLRSEGWIAVGLVQKRRKTTQAGGPAFLLPGGRKEHLVHQGLRGQPGGSQLSGGGCWLGWTLVKGLSAEGLVNSVKDLELYTKSTGKPSYGFCKVVT